MRKKPNLIDKWFTSLPPDARHAVQLLSSTADQHGFSIYLVGGPLRDLLLGYPSLDIDISVEGDALTLARDLAAQLAVRLRLHLAFGTATILGDGWHIDLATGRSETYRRPGALPTITAATIDEDLQRRDFTINAMALRLNGPDAGAFVDPVGGQRDLRSRVIRVLHDRSFQDDATRILRAVRYAARFSFEIEPRTLARLRRDLTYLDTISPARLHQESARILREPDPGPALRRLDELGALHQIHPALSFTSAQASALDWLREQRPHSLPATGWPLLALNADLAGASGIARRLALTRAQRDAVQAVPALRAALPRLREPDLAPSALALILAPFPPTALLAVAAAEPGVVRERCLDYLDRLRHFKTRLRGEDVITLGVPRGPEVGEVLRRLRLAKLDGELRTRKDEERFVRRFLAEARA